MPLAESIFAKLSADAAVSALIGDSDSCRLFPGVAPEGVALPYVVYTEIAADQDGATHDASSDFERMTVQFSIVAGKWSDARDTRKAIRNALTDATLTGGEKTVSFMPRQGFSDSVDAHVAMLDVDFWHNPSAA